MWCQERERERERERGRERERERETQRLRERERDSEREGERESSDKQQHSSQSSAQRIQLWTAASARTRWAPVYRVSRRFVKDPTGSDRVPLLLSAGRGGNGSGVYFRRSVDTFLWRRAAVTVSGKHRLHLFRGEAHTVHFSVNKCWCAAAAATGPPDAWAPFVTDVFTSIHRHGGLSPSRSPAGCRAVHTFIVQCHCGSERLHRHDAATPGVWGHLAADRERRRAVEMYGASGIPELIPPAGPPRQPGPAGQYNPGHPQVNGHGGGSNPQRLGQRAPKLGQIGRSKKGERGPSVLDRCRGLQLYVKYTRWVQQLHTYRV